MLRPSRPAPAMHTQPTVPSRHRGSASHLALACLLTALPLSFTSCNRATDKAAIRSETQRADALRNQLAQMKAKAESTTQRLELMRQQAALTPSLAALKDGQTEVEKRRTELTTILKGLQEANRNLRLEVDSARKTSVAGTR